MTKPKTKPKFKPKAKRRPAMEHKTHPKPAPKVEVKPVPPAPPAPAAAAAPKVEPKPEPKPVGPKLDDATLEQCALLAETYISRNTTQHTPRDLLAYEIAAAIRAKKGGK